MKTSFFYKKFSKELTEELGKGYSDRHLRKMRQFYLELKEEIWKPLVSKLTWSHIYKLLTIENTNKRNYYINQCIKIREFKKQDIGQIKLYMNYIDQHIKKPTNNKTVGIIICREENRFVLKYVKESDIFITKYITI